MHLVLVVGPYVLWSYESFIENSQKGKAILNQVGRFTNPPYDIIKTSPRLGEQSIRDPFFNQWIQNFPLKFPLDIFPQCPTMFENKIMPIHKTFPKPVFACPGAAAHWQAFS